MIAKLKENECFSISAHKKTNQCTHCNMISYALCHACTYSADAQEGVTDVCINYNACVCIATGIKIFSPHTLAMDSYV